MIVLKIVSITTLTFFVGSAIFFGWSSGISGLLMSPILAAFGWYLWPLILWLVILLWCAYMPRIGFWVYRLAFIAICVAVGFLGSLLVYRGGFEGDSVLGEASRVAFTVSGFFAGALIVSLKRSAAPRKTSKVG